MEHFKFTQFVDVAVMMHCILYFGFDSKKNLKAENCSLPNLNNKKWHSSHPSIYCIYVHRHVDKLKKFRHHFMFLFLS